ncbi:hypothetical protein ACOSQ4_026720 [Xanthoceras sorbifolium]
MGRVKVPLKKVENKTYRHVSFSKRKNGLVKKAYELSTLCDVDVGLIIFSPAGKLVLFDGKRRTEETLKSYIDLPLHQRGRLHKQERVRRLVSQTCIESDLWQRINSSSDMDSRMVDIQVQSIQNEISLRNVELEDVEKQLEDFIKSTRDIKSLAEVEYYESMLEDTMKRVSLHKQVLEKKGFSQLPSQILHPQTANASNFMMGSPNYGLGWPQQHGSTQFLTNNFTNSTGFQPFRNETDPFAEMFPTPMAFNSAGYSVGNAATGDFDMLQSSMAFNSTGYPSGNAVSGGSDELAPSMAFPNTEYLARNEVSGGSNHLDYEFFCSPYYDQFFSANIAAGNNIQQGRTTPVIAGPSQVVGDAAVGSDGSSPSFHDFPEIPFPFYHAST